MAFTPSGARCTRHLTFDEGCLGCEIGRLQERLRKVQSEYSALAQDHALFQTAGELLQEEMKDVEARLEREREDRIQAENARDEAEAEQERLEKEFEAAQRVLTACELICERVLRVWVADLAEEDWRHLLGRAELARRGLP